jgi:hypothetical protein
LHVAEKWLQDKVDLQFIVRSVFMGSVARMEKVEKARAQNNPNSEDSAIAYN